MHRLRIESHFDAAHKLVGYKGKCSKLHGHTWKVEVFVIGEKPDNIGILVDFKTLKKNLCQITEKLDHSYLNHFKDIGNPTSENISRYIYRNLKDLPESVRLEKVRVWESTNSWCEYFQS
ncbi:MAG: 6-carboxytetrahydropterin synthase QueD [Candidatus Bathyarchaeia archaeon]